ncbi:MAG TPA: hypothetical protein VF911_02020 [Thermoanaerobaculia bacterium]
MSLIAAEIERRGIATVCLMLLRDVAEKVRPPRALVVPYAHGFPLGTPDDAEGQKQIMRAALALLDRDAPVIETYRPKTR